MDKSDQYDIPKYGVIEHVWVHHKKKKSAQTELREWLSVGIPCFFVNGKAYRFERVIPLKDKANGFALVLKHDNVIWAITPSPNHPGVSISAYKKRRLFNDKITKIIKGNLRTLTNGLTPKEVFSVASDLFQTERLTPLYSFIFFESNSNKPIYDSNPKEKKSKHKYLNYHIDSSQRIVHAGESSFFECPVCGTHRDNPIGTIISNYAIRGHGYICTGCNNAIITSEAKNNTQSKPTNKRC